MRRKFSITNSIGKKNMILAIVALVLILVTVIGTSFSWIEEVSQVEFNSNEGQETPLHVGSKILKSDAIMKSNPSTDDINLEDYFYESGDIHLSPCYSNGEKFYFPVKKNADTSSNTVSFREGTKDDANVNYLSATFRVRSDNADTAYWFEKIDNNELITCKKNDDTSIDLKEYLRVSVTVDGDTNVYAYNTNGKYYTLASSSATSATKQNGRSLREYMYYSEDFYNSNPVGSYKRNASPDNKTVKYNQGKSDNLNGNTLFTVQKYDSDLKNYKTVTLKIWLEYNNNGINDVKLSNLNLKLTSSWAKLRRIYVKDATVEQEGYTTSKWLSNENAQLFWVLKDDITNENKRFPLSRVETSDYYYVDIPAVYNYQDVVLMRSPSWNSGGVYYPSSSAATKVQCWDFWETKFPDSFHSDTFTVYSHDFGTWNEEEVNSIFIVNSCDFENMRDYMWDSNSVINNDDINAKVVKNANWPGIKMTTKMKTKTSSQSLTPYAFFYNADYDRIIFNDGDYEAGKNHEYQTQDLWLTASEKNCTFDMATLTWFGTNPTKSDWNSKMPNYSSSNTYLYCNMSTDKKWKKTRFAWDGQYDSSTNYNDNAFMNTSSSNMLCKLYNKSSDTSSDYECIVYINGTAYKAHKNGSNQITPGGSSYTLKSGNDYDRNLYIKNLKPKTVYRFYVTFDNGNPVISVAEGESLATPK